MSALGMLGEAIEYDQILEHFMGDATEQEIENAVNILAKTGYIKLCTKINSTGFITQTIELTEKGRTQCKSM
jgi:hypothetical protein